VGGREGDDGWGLGGVDKGGGSVKGSKGREGGRGRGEEDKWEGEISSGGSVEGMWMKGRGEK